MCERARKDRPQAWAVDLVCTVMSGKRSVMQADLMSRGEAVQTLYEPSCLFVLRLNPLALLLCHCLQPPSSGKWQSLFTAHVGISIYTVVAAGGRYRELKLLSGLSFLNPLSLFLP